jgi:uncharacterized protein (TIGR02145 family)
MKKLLSLILLFYSLTANSQNYLITFAGSGASSIVNTVNVENLTNGTSLSLNGSDILYLKEGVITGVNSIENSLSSKMKIYPNPMINNATFTINPPVDGNATISIIDINGRHITQIQSYLKNYPQQFHLSGIEKGVYLINVKGDGYHFSGKLVSIANSNGPVHIEKTADNPKIDSDKKLSGNAKGTQAIVEMSYTTGDRLKFTGISGNYSTVVKDIPSQDNTITFNFIECTDRDNNNLKTTKYLNSDLIGTTTPATLDTHAEATPKYQWANSGNESNVATYGRLYTWYAVTDSRNVCPTGWHVPSDDEWTTLSNYLIINGYGYGGSGNFIGKSMASTVGWIIDTAAGSVGNDQAGNNSTGFTGLPSGSRDIWGGFYLDGRIGSWWSSTEYSTSYVFCRFVAWDFPYLARPYGARGNGYSVRCLHD